MLSVLKESAVLVHAGSRPQALRAEARKGSVIFKRAVLVNQQSVQLMYTFRMAHHVTITRPIASQESAKHMTPNAKNISEQVCVIVGYYTMLADIDYLHIFHMFSDKGVNECFTRFNTRGDYYGNCGSNGNSFIPCTTR